MDLYPPDQLNSCFAPAGRQPCGVIGEPVRGQGDMLAVLLDTNVEKNQFGEHLILRKWCPSPQLFGSRKNDGAGFIQTAFSSFTGRVWAATESFGTRCGKQAAAMNSRTESEISLIIYPARHL